MNEQLEANINNHAQDLTAKRNYWRKIIKQWQSNPIKTRDFCKLKGVNSDQFDYWRRKFTKTKNNIDNSPVKKSNQGFIEVVAETTSAVDYKTSAINIEPRLHITLPNNIQLVITMPMPHIKGVKPG